MSFFVCYVELMFWLWLDEKIIPEVSKTLEAKIIENYYAMPGILYDIQLWRLNSELFHASCHNLKVKYRIEEVGVNYRHNFKSKQYANIVQYSLHSFSYIWNKSHHHLNSFLRSSSPIPPPVPILLQVHASRHCEVEHWRSQPELFSSRPHLHEE